MGTKQYETTVTKEHYDTGYNDPYSFASFQKQLTEVLKTKPKKVLEVGSGNKLVYNQLKTAGINVIHADINEHIQPDVVADIRQLPFKDNTFDTTCAFEVLEHIPFSDFEQGLKEILRTTKQYTIISLPIRRFGLTMTCDFNLFHNKHIYIQPPEWITDWVYSLTRQGLSEGHYWEIDYPNYRTNTIRNIIQRHAVIRKEYRVPNNPRHYMFVLEKKE